MDERTITTVEIAGEEYTIRSEASREYTIACASMVDQAVAQVMERGSLVEAHKAAILAALALADQLIQAREAADRLRDEVALKSARLLEEIDERSPSADLASLD